MEVPILDKGIDDFGSWLNIMKDHKLVTQAGAWYTFKDQDGNVKSLRKIAIIFDDTTVMDGIPKGKPINKEEDLNDYDFQEPTDILNFNRLRNATSQTDLDSAEILIIKNILDEKENNVNSVTRNINTGY
mgnify:CR=1 FL=1